MWFWIEEAAVTQEVLADCEGKMSCLQDIEAVLAPHGIGLASSVEFLAVRLRLRRYVDVLQHDARL